MVFHMNSNVEDTSYLVDVVTYYDINAPSA